MIKVLGVNTGVVYEVSDVRILYDEHSTYYQNKETMIVNRTMEFLFSDGSWNDCKYFKPSKNSNGDFVMTTGHKYYPRVFIYYFKVNIEGKIRYVSYEESNGWFYMDGSLKEVDVILKREGVRDE